MARVLFAAHGFSRCLVGQETPKSATVLYSLLLDLAPERPPIGTLFEACRIEQ